MCLPHASCIPTVRMLATLGVMAYPLPPTRGLMGGFVFYVKPKVTADESALPDLYHITMLLCQHDKDMPTSIPIIIEQKKISILFADWDIVAAVVLVELHQMVSIASKSASPLINLDKSSKLSTASAKETFPVLARMIIETE